MVENNQIMAFRDPIYSGVESFLRLILGDLPRKLVLLRLTIILKKIDDLIKKRIKIFLNKDVLHFRIYSKVNKFMTFLILKHTQLLDKPSNKYGQTTFHLDALTYFCFAPINTNKD